MKNIYIIVVGVDVYQYGPFDNHEEAHKWLGNGSAFFGRKVFIQCLDPIRIK